MMDDVHSTWPGNAPDLRRYILPMTFRLVIDGSRRDLRRDNVKDKMNPMSTTDPSILVRLVRNGMKKWLSRKIIGVVGVGKGHTIWGTTRCDNDERD